MGMNDFCVYKNKVSTSYDVLGGVSAHFFHHQVSM